MLEKNKNSLCPLSSALLRPRRYKAAFTTIPRITLLQLLIVYKTIYLINCFSPSLLFVKPGWEQQSYKIDVVM